MTEDKRTPFLDAVAAFKNFAADHGKPHDLAWISQDRVRVKLGSVWIFGAAGFSVGWKSGLIPSIWKA